MKSHNPIEKENHTVEMLLQIIRELTTEIHLTQTPLQPITLDSSLDHDLGLDSLARMELFERIERSFGVALPERVFTDAETPRDLARAVYISSGPRTYPKTTPLQSTISAEKQAEPAEEQTLVDVLYWHVTHHPDRPHITLYRDEDQDDIMTYLQLWKGAETIAGGLQNLGLKSNDTVAIMLPTGREYFYSFMGILLAGGIPVPIYPPARLSQLEDHLRRHAAILSNCLAVALITVKEAKNVARFLKTQVETLRYITTVEELQSTSYKVNKPKIGEQNIAFLQYTSGSTGNPKGVILSHANLLANIRTMGKTIRVSANDVFISWLPLYHDMGLIGAWLGSLYYGFLLVIMSPLSFLSSPQRWLWAMHRYRGTLSAAPNFAYEICNSKLDLANLKGLDLSSWRIAFNGAESVNPYTVENFCQRFAPYGFKRETMMPVYGLAEVALALAFPPLGRGPLIDNIQREKFMSSGKAVPAHGQDTNTLQLVACGQPLPGYQVRIVDGYGRELPERQEGRLQFRGPSATSGYYRNSEETRKLFYDDWLESGDLAYIASGDIYITGRIKDIIIRAGRNIYPQELEQAVGKIPEVRKGCVAVFSSPEPTAGTERLVVLAETRLHEAQALENVRSQINETVMDLIGTPPDDTVLVPPHTVLKTSSGKIRRAASREIYEQGKLGKRPKMIWWQFLRLTLSALLPQLRRIKRSISDGAYAAYAWSLFGILAPLAWLSVALLPNVSWRWKSMHFFANFLMRASGTPLTVHEPQNLPPPNQPCIIVANHTSYLDGFALVAALPFEFSFVAKMELSEHLIPRVFLHKIHAEFVERFDKQKGIQDALRTAHLAKQGYSLVFFPEGTFTRAPGLLPFHMGAFVAAVEAGIPVIPISIRGTRSILRADEWLPRHGGISVTIGDPIKPAIPNNLTPAERWTEALSMRNAAREQILHYCGEPDLSPQ